MELSELAVLALVISAMSLAVSFLNFAWNIYRELLLRARLRVGISVGFLVSERGSSAKDFIILDVTSLGPGKVHLVMIHARIGGRFFRRAAPEVRNAVLVHDYHHPYCSKLPIMLEPGQQVTYLFPCQRESFLGLDLRRVGIKDAFGRMHWVRRKTLRKARKDWRERYPNLPGRA